MRLLHVGLDERRAPGLHAVGVDGRRRDALAVPRVRRQAVHRHELRVAPAPRAAGRAGRDRATAARSRSSAGRCSRTSRWRASAASSTSPTAAVIDIDETPKLRARRGVHRLHRFAGRADERAVADGRARAQAREDLARRRRRDQRARDPGQRVERVARDRLAAPRRRRSRARPHVAGARVRARVAGRAEVPAQPARSRSGSCPCTASTATSCTTRSSRTTSASPPTACSSARTATSITLTADGAVRRAPRGAGRATCTSTGSSATSATACCATARMLSEEGVVVVIVTVDTAGRRDRDRPRDRHPRLGVRARSRGSASKTPSRSVRASIDGAIAEGATDFDTMRRHARTSLGTVHRRAHPAPADRDPGRHGSLRTDRVALEISCAGRRALVTGGGNGVGAAIGRALVARGRVRVGQRHLRGPRGRGRGRARRRRARAAR